MKRSIVSIVVLACLVLVLALVASFNAVSSAKAQIGNTGVVVRCTTVPDYWIAPNAQSDITCFSVDGTSFVTVPAAHYLFVSDVLVAPYSGSATGTWGVNLTVPNSISSPITWFTWSTSGTYLQHFTTPFIVAKDGQKLVAQNYPGSPTNISVLLYGVLTTNANYLPLIAR
jgi:hypothetical protein